MSWLNIAANGFKKTLKKFLGEGLAGISGDHGSDTLYDVMRAMIRSNDNRLLEGLFAIAPTTPNTQATGAGNTNWRINIEKGVCRVNGVNKEFAAQNDFAIHTGSNLAGFVNGASCVAAIVAKNVNGTITCVAVKGTPATTGTQVAPTDAQIQAAVGAAVPWIKLSETTINRTGDIDTTTTAHDNSKADYGDGVVVE